MPIEGSAFGDVDARPLREQYSVSFLRNGAPSVFPSKVKVLVPVENFESTVPAPTARGGGSESGSQGSHLALSPRDSPNAGRSSDALLPDPISESANGNNSGNMNTNGIKDVDYDQDYHHNDDGVEDVDVDESRRGAELELGMYLPGAVSEDERAGTDGDATEVEGI
jgi:hypothetical protein